MEIFLAPWDSARPAAGDADSVMAMHSAPSAMTALRRRSADGLDMEVLLFSAVLPTGLADGLASRPRVRSAHVRTGATASAEADSPPPPAASCAAGGHGSPAHLRSGRG